MQQKIDAISWRLFKMIHKNQIYYSNKDDRIYLIDNGGTARKINLQYSKEKWIVISTVEFIIRSVREKDLIRIGSL